jgi:hypothetical protein
MPEMLVNLRGVPEDEVSEIIQLLTDNEISFYETPPGNWGISMPALWVREEAEKQKALPLLESYQISRAAKARDAYEKSKKSGEQKSALQNLLDNPFKKIIYLSFIAVILFFSIKPFLSLGSNS